MAGRDQTGELGLRKPLAGSTRHSPAAKFPAAAAASAGKPQHTDKARRHPAPSLLVPKMSEAEEQKYMTAFWSELPRQSRELLESRASDRSPSRPQFHTRAFRYSAGGLREDIDLSSLALPAYIPKKTVLVVENIDLHWISALGLAWEIEPKFFARHVSSEDDDGRDDESVWRGIFGALPSERRKPFGCLYGGWTRSAGGGRATALKGVNKGWHVDGVIGCGWSGVQTSGPGVGANFLPRRVERAESVERAEGVGWIVGTRISCLVRNYDAYLILVDASPDPPASLSFVDDFRSEMLLPLAGNSGGLRLPALFERGPFSTCDCLQQFLSHTWNFDVLFPKSKISPSPMVIFHVLVASTWTRNFRLLDEQIKHTSFRELHYPSIKTNNLLHARREELASLRSGVELARKWMPASVHDELQKILQIDEAHAGFPDAMMRDLLDDIASLERFLMDSFKLLLTSASVWEVENGLQQSKRTKRLTWLAFLYIPLSFIIGVFGMNVKEINDLPVRFIVLTLAATVACTVALLLSYLLVQRVFEKQERRYVRTSDVQISIRED